MRFRVFDVSEDGAMITWWRCRYCGEVVRVRHIEGEVDGWFWDDKGYLYHSHEIPVRAELWYVEEKDG